MYTLPTTVKIRDNDFKIRNKGDFRMVLDCFNALQDNNLSQQERVISSLIIFYDDVHSYEDLCVLFKDDEDSVNYIAKIKDRLVSSIKKHAYINSFYTRVLINRPNANNISYVGSKGDKLSINPECDGAYYLNSFSWSLLSNVASEEEIKEMLPIVEKYLKTPSGFRLFSKSVLFLYSEGFISVFCSDC